VLSVLIYEVDKLTIECSHSFDEFHVETELPSPPLQNFYGRDDILASMEILLHTSIYEKDHRCQRNMIVLQGMGGMGKSQTTLEYVHRNKDDYSAIIWIDATNPGTVETSARRIMNELISHYATKYHGQQQFTSVAVDLRIPGQIDNSGQLTGNAAKSPWHCVRRWMVRKENARWCLVIDSINNEDDVERMRELLPACAHGHIIITSRIRISESELIPIPELEKQFSVKLLLGSKIDTVTDKGNFPLLGLML
jgi:hypothetical protein